MLYFLAFLVQGLNPAGPLTCVVTIAIVLLLLPTLFGKRGIFTRSPLLWEFETLSFLCYHVHLPRLSY